MYEYFKNKQTKLTKSGNGPMERACSSGSEETPKLNSLGTSNLCNFRGIIQSLRLWFFFHKIVLRMGITFPILHHSLCEGKGLAICLLLFYIRSNTGCVILGGTVFQVCFVSSYSGTILPTTLPHLQI